MIEQSTSQDHNHDESSTSMNTRKTLAELTAGTEALITDVNAGEPHGIRLLELGLIPGTTILVKQSGQSMILAFNGTRLAIDTQSASLISVIRL